ncbi:MAG TPA: hypothetical protein VFY93_14430 [Planctomycetota bacterium]|nr:hypothetical protein [Planctomycetota bacterium]
MRALRLLLPFAAFGCAAPHAPEPSSATEGMSGLLRVVLMLDKLK